MMGTMSSIKEIMQFCRLCLVKDQVNVSIFEEHGDTRDVKRKISECLPVTVSEEDSLPKKICDGCLYKLELLYQFRTTCVSAEKQLQVWIAELNNSESKEDQDLKLQHSQTSVKEEIFDATDHPDNSEYVIEEQHISYEEGDIPYNESQDDNDDGDATNSSDDEPLAKRRKRFLEEQVQTDDTLKTADNKMAITKLEHESDDENVDDPEPNFVSVGTSDDQQPGPSGLNKMSATTTNAEMPKITFILLHSQKKKHEPKVQYRKCDICDLILPNAERLSKHKRVHREKTFPCDLCNMKFKYNYEVVVHKRQRHEKFKPETCTVCSKRLASKTSLLLHMKCRHTNEIEFQCDQCDKGYTTEKALHEHTKTVHKGVRYYCAHCKKVYRNEQYFKQHMRIHEPDYVKTDHVCSVCSKSLSSAVSLYKHMTIHNGTSAKYVCEICGKKLSSTKSLVIHKRLHTGEKPEVCRFCDKTFVDKGRVKDHERTHTKEKPYICKICGKGFSQCGSLKIHTRYHTGERPYVCNVCNKGFVTKSAMKTHSNSH
ncbi:zinc finger protein 585A-like isoform X13 [Onthophagus taurus]|uniref:zinc finger protein 585A-like isoform X13 n=1 Tax=Onthophagus taurus TaxID=166361 RepID=UPI000C20BEAA|nr:zinc finger protein OZF-like isoform X9 [Onthophagus taurus]